MGEAKRRKALGLGPKGPKKPKEPSPSQQSENPIELIEKIPTKPNYEFTNRDIFNAVRLNFFKELFGLRLRVEKGWSMSPFDKGRLALFEAIAKAFEIDRLQDITDDGFEAVKPDIRKAGEMLHESGGMRDMQDSLIFLFLPREIHRSIDLYWHGVGDWLS